MLPTDKLFRAREAKQSARDLNEPFYAHGEVQSSSMLFAQRQWAAMQEDKTLTEAEAYKKVERDMEVARATALEQVRSVDWARPRTLFFSRLTLDCTLMHSLFSPQLGKGVDGSSAGGRRSCACLIARLCSASSEWR